MTVWAVTYSDYDEYTVLGVFDNEAAAAGFAPLVGGDVEEWEVHSETPHEIKWWSITMWLEKGTDPRSSVIEHTAWSHEHDPDAEMWSTVHLREGNMYRPGWAKSDDDFRWNPGHLQLFDTDRLNGLKRAHEAVRTALAEGKR